MADANMRGGGVSQPGGSSDLETALKKIIKGGDLSPGALSKLSASDLYNHFNGNNVSQADINQLKDFYSRGDVKYSVGDDAGSRLQTLFDQSNAYGNQLNLQKQSQDQANKQSAYADSLQQQSDKFRGDLGKYTGDQIDNAQNISRRNLNTDKQQVKENSNSRGLLYSGVKAGDDASAEGYESANLGKQIQGINTNANNQANAKDQFASMAKAGADQSQIAVQQQQARQNETAYQQALQQQQSQNNFWQSLLGGVGSFVGGGLGMLKGGGGK